MFTSVIKSQKNLNLWLVILGITVLNVIGAYLNNPILIGVFKPLISLSLIYYAYKRQRLFSLPIYRSLIIALLCGLMGDLALMPATQFDHSFLIGLVSFLLGHLAYIHVFIKLGEKYEGSIAKQLLALGFSFYAVWIYANLYPNIVDEGLAIPVFVYCFILIALAFVATFGREGAGYRVRLLGVGFFVISDSALAWGAFIWQTPLLNAFVIATYCLAQIFIVHGVIQYKTDRN